MEFGIKDIIDIVMVALLLFYVYRLMKESGTLSIFVGVLAFIVAWVVISGIFNMRLMGAIMDKFMSIGLIILVIIFQEQIKRFLVEIGSHRRWKYIRRLLHRRDKDDDDKRWIMPVVYACMNMSKSKTGALIVVRQNVQLDDYEHSGDIINADINSRLIENIFFKNSPLHDGAMIIAGKRITSVGCILPVSHDTDVPRNLGLRHRSALGIAQVTDAMAVVVSEETGNISLAYKGSLHLNLTSTELEHMLTHITS